MLKKILICFSFIALSLTLFACVDNGDKGGEITVIPDYSTKETNLDYSVNRIKVADAIVNLINNTELYELKRATVLERLDEWTFDEQTNVTYLEKILKLLGKAGITQSELNSLYTLLADIGTIVGNNAEDQYDEDFVLDIDYMAERIKEIFIIIDRFEKIITPIKIGTFVNVLIDFVIEAELMPITDEINMPTKNETIFLVQFLFDIIDCIKKQDTKKIAGLYMFLIDLTSLGIEDLISYEIYSYREIITFINDFGKILIDLTDSMKPRAKLVEEIILNIFKDLIPTFSLEITLSDILSVCGYESLIAQKFLGLLLSNLTYSEFSEFYLDFDDINKYAGNDEAIYDKKNAIPIVRGAKMFITTYNKLATSEQKAFLKWIDSYLNLMIKNIDVDIYDLTQLKTITAEKIINDIKRIAVYNQTNLTSAQVNDVKSTLMAYYSKFLLVAKEGYEPLFYSIDYVFEGYTSASIKDAYNAMGYFENEITSVEILKSNSSMVKIKIYFEYELETYWDVQYLIVRENPIDTATEIIEDDITQNMEPTWYQFTPEVSNTYSIYSFNANNSDPYVELYDSSLVQIAYNDDDDYSTNFKLTYYLVAGETYYIYARGYGNTAKYQFVIESITTSLNATEIAENSVIYNIQPSWYEFVPATSASYTIYSFNYIYDDPYMELYDSSLQRIGYDDDGGHDRNFSLTYDFIANEVYYIYVRSYGSTSEPAEYQFIIEKTALIIDAITIMEEVMIEHSGEARFEFTPSRTSIYVILFQCYSGSADIELFDSSFNFIRSGVNIEDDITYLFFNSIAGEKYYINIANATYFSNYQFAVGDYAENVGGIAITSDTPIQATPGAGYIFIPEVSATYTIYSYNCTSGDPYVEVYNIMENLIYTDDDNGLNYNFSLTCHLVAGELYYIAAYDHSSYYNYQFIII